MNRVFAATLLLILSLPPVWAQDIQTSLPSGQILRGHFVQIRQINGFITPLRSEGQFTFAPGNGLIWTVTAPYVTKTVATNTGLFQINVDIRTQSRSGPPRSGQSLSWQKIPTASAYYSMLSNLLSGNISELHKTFRLDVSGRPSRWRISLVPRIWGDPFLPFREIRARGGHFTEEILLMKSDGESERLTFDAMTTGHNTLTDDEQNIYMHLMP